VEYKEVSGAAAWFRADSKRTCYNSSGFGLMKSLGLPLAANQIKQLFLAVVFPIHFWAILLFILNAPNPQNANAWGEALAIAGYILLFALVESAAVFVVLLLLAWLLPRRWMPEQRLGALLAILALLVLWALVSQLATLLVIPQTPFFVYIGINLANTLLYRQIAFGLMVIFVLLTVVAALHLGSSPRFAKRLGPLLERIELLSVLYLLLDLAAFVFVVSRNV
jgi:hypothetical protein